MILRCSKHSCRSSFSCATTSANSESDGTMLSACRAIALKSWCQMQKSIEKHSEQLKDIDAHRGFEAIQKWLDRWCEVWCMANRVGSQRWVGLYDQQRSKLECLQAHELEESHIVISHFHLCAVFQWNPANDGMETLCSAWDCRWMLPLHNFPIFQWFHLYHKIDV